MNNGLSKSWPNLQDLLATISGLLRSISARKHRPSPSDYVYVELRGTDNTDNNSELPTPEERDILRRVADAIPWNAYRA